MKKCSFCAEMIQDDAVLCRFCNRAVPAVQTKSEETKSATVTGNDRKLAKWLLLSLVALAAVTVWYVAIPAAIIWYLWKNKKFDKRTRIILTLALAVAGIVTAYVISSSNAPARITVTDPNGEARVQSDSYVIKGTVQPIAGADLTINSKKVALAADGTFEQEVVLDQEMNVFTLAVSRGGSHTETKVRIGRIFSEAELAERAAKAEAARIEKERLAQEAKAKAESERIAKLKDKLIGEIKAIDEFDSAIFRGSAAALGLEIGVFSNDARLISESKKEADPEILALASDLEKKLSQLQVKEFPLMRKAFAETLSKDLWLENAEVNAIGTGNRTLEFISGSFASNRNIAEAHSSIVDVLESLRFTRANYKWYEYDSDYSYYELTPPKDSDVVERKD